MSRTATWFRETATFGDGMPERVVNQWLEASMALHTPVCGATTCRPRTITWSRMHWPSQFRRSTRLLPPSAIVTTLWAASWMMLQAVAREPRLEAPARPGSGFATAASFSDRNEIAPPVGHSNDLVGRILDDAAGRRTRAQAGSASPTWIGLRNSSLLFRSERDCSPRRP